MKQTVAYFRHLLDAVVMPNFAGSQGHRAPVVHARWQAALLSEAHSVASRLPHAVCRLADRIAASPIGVRFAHGALWSLVGAAACGLLAMLTNIVVARLLGRQGFGELEVILGTAALFQVFAGLGLGLTSTRHLALFSATEPARASRVLSLTLITAAGSGVVGAVCLWFAAPFLAAGVLAAEHLTDLLRKSAPIIALGSFAGVQMGALLGLEVYPAMTRVTFLSGLVALPLMTAGTLLSGIEGAVFCFALTLACKSALSQRALRTAAITRGLQLWPAGWYREGLVLWRFAFPALLTDLLNWPVTWVGAAIVVNGSGGYGEYGLYAAAEQWLTALLLLPGIVRQVMTPMLSDHLGRHDQSTARRILLASLTATATLATLTALLISLGSPLIMELYGADFAHGWRVLIIVMAAAVLAAMQQPVGGLLDAAGRMWTNFLMSAGRAILFLGGLYVWADCGALGLALARLLAEGAHATCSLAYARTFLARRRTASDSDTADDAPACV